MINNVTLMGRLTAAPTLKQTNSGVAVTSFSLAVDRQYQKQGEERQTDFINCVAWRNTAEFISKYFNKGDMLAVIGEIQTRNYEDRDGNKRIAFEVIINQASFCGSKSNNNNAPVQTTPTGNIDDFMPVEFDEDLPF